MILFNFFFKHKFFCAFVFIFAISFLGGCTPFVTREYNLSEPFQDIIASRQGVWGAYTSAEIIIEGYFSGYGHIFFRERNPEDFASGAWAMSILSIQENINKRVTFDWYLDFVAVEFTPIEPGEGNLRIRFRLRPF